MPFDYEAVQRGARLLADNDVLIGASSWKYPGWLGQIYDEQRYLWRNKFANSRFEKGCLEEYGAIFSTVSVDAGYYRFPSQQYLASLAAQVPDGFKLSFKVTDEITIKKFTKLPRFGDKAGKENENFLNAQLFADAFLHPCDAIKDKVGLMMFEFSKFYPGQFERGAEFVERLDRFLGEIPKNGWQYGVEMRNKNFLHPEYFDALRRHGVTHVYNNWEQMPPVSEQMTLQGSRTVDDFAAARFLLKPGRAYADAVEAFEPYETTKEVDEDARGAGAGLIQQLLAENQAKKANGQPSKPSFLFVNNRLEGNALLTIEAMMRLGGILG